MTFVGNQIPRHVLDFARVSEFLGLLQPLTPYGRDILDSTGFIENGATLERLYDDIEAAGRAVRSLQSKGTAFERVCWHLGRMPRLPSIQDAASWGLMELFLVKKFLAHCKAAGSLLDDATVRYFGLDFTYEDLLAHLAAGNADAESFAITERHEPRLAAIRARLGELTAQAKTYRKSLESRVRDSHGLEFMGREFLLVTHEKGLALARACSEPDAPRIEVEPYDERYVKIRLLPDAALLTLEEERRAARETERTLEEEVIRRLAQEVASCGEQIEHAVQAIGRFDAALARWTLANSWRMTRPQLGRAEWRCRGGRLVPLALECQERGFAYVPLDLELDKPVALLTGSNMGGKTCVLQTVLFLQVLAQTGNFVPADSLQAPLCAWVDVVGSEIESNGARRGLSSFGYEIHRLTQVLRRARSQPGLVVFDEFAQTTSGEEGRAIMQAVSEHLARYHAVRALFATHLACDFHHPYIRHFRMAGLNRDAARAALASGANSADDTRSGVLSSSSLAEGRDGADGTAPASERDLTERLRAINAMMQYRVIPAELSQEILRSDAIMIAELLGLDRPVIDRARALLEGERQSCDPS